MYYKCPNCGVLKNGPRTDEWLNNSCPNCGASVVLEDYDQPFLDSQNKQENLVLTVFAIFIVLGLCGIVARLAG